MCIPCDYGCQFGFCTSVLISVRIIMTINHNFGDISTLIHTMSHEGKQHIVILNNVTSVYI